EAAMAFRRSAVDGHVDLKRWGRSAMGELFPLWMLKYLPNMPACHIGIGQDARGPNNTITLGDVSSLSALAEAVRVLDRGQADALIAGGVGARLHPLDFARGQVTGLTRQADPAVACRPFDARRDGVVNGEGAGSVILEPDDKAQARGANRLARVLGCANVFAPPADRSSAHGTAASDRSSADGTASCDRLAADGTSVPARVGLAIRRAVRGALDDAGLTPADVGLVVAHGVSTVDDDRVEAQAIHEVLGDVPLTAPKSYFGHLGPGAGALETALAVLALQHRLIPPTLNYERPDPECPANVVRGQPAPLAKPVALILSHTRYGQAVAVALGGI
ncbi:MAG: beta-ketoacyl synthase N-terminal-like domain-containing protein, partial [Thermoguttaceae bacterium]